MREVCYKARELLIEEGNVVGVDAPVTVGFLILRKTKTLLTGDGGRFAVTSMASSMILWSCSVLVAMCQTPTIYSWVRDCLALITQTRALLIDDRRLCRPRLLFPRIIPPSSLPQGPIPRPNHTHQRQPRITTNYDRLWLLRRMFAQIRQCERVEILLRGL